MKGNSEIVCIAKHLCGGATDLSLTSILKRQKSSPVVGVAIATCCHHQCDLKTFCNLAFLEANGFTQSEIVYLPRFTSWAIAQTTLDKKVIGFKTKRILDFARIEYIKACLPNLKVGAITYCDPITESPESTLLIAFK